MREKKVTYASCFLVAVELHFDDSGTCQKILVQISERLQSTPQNSSRDSLYGYGNLVRDLTYLPIFSSCWRTGSSWNLKPIKAHVNPHDACNEFMSFPDKQTVRKVQATKNTYSINRNKILNYLAKVFHGHFLNYCPFIVCHGTDF